MKIWIRAVFMTVLLFMFHYPQHPQYAAALSCVQPPPIEGAYQKYDGVIIGKVENVIRQNDSNQVKLKVLKSYKAITDNSLSVKEDITWGSLWGPSEIGQEYLFFLRQKNNVWENPLCSPTKKLADATEELKVLQDKEIPLKPPSATPATSADDKNATELIDSKGSTANNSPSTWQIILIGAGLLGIMGYGIFRFIRRGK